MTIEELELAVQALAGDVTTLVQQFELTTGVNIHSLAVDRDKPTTPAIVRVRTRLKMDH